MTKKIFALLAATAMAAGAANGQDGLNRQVDVTKDYTPLVDRAAKLKIEPQMGDTTTLRPDFDYTVEPRGWVSRFGVEPIRAARLDVGGSEWQRPLYLKAGFGLPGQSVLDVYVNSTRAGASGVGAYVNHRGQFADIDNVRARSTTNSAVVFGRAVMGRWSVAGEVGADYDVWTDYVSGRSMSSDGASAGRIGAMQHYATPRAAIVVGNDFTDLSRLNIRFGADVYLFSDRHDYKEHGARVFAEAGRRFGVHELKLRGEVRRWGSDSEANDAMSNTVVIIAPRYELVRQSVMFRMGMQVAAEARGGSYMELLEPGGSYTKKSLDTDDLWFMPEAEVKFVLDGGTVCPYASLNGELLDNSGRTITAGNPYAASMLSVAVAPGVTREHTLHAGLKGHIGQAFSYNIFVGGERRRNAPMHTMRMAAYNTGGASGWLPDGVVFTSFDKVEALVAGAEVEVAASGFTASAAVRYSDYKDFKGLGRDDYLPKLRGSLRLSYARGAKWALHAGADFRGSYVFLTYPGQPDVEIYDAPAAVDLSLGADYRLSDWLSVFVEGRNLAGQKLYPYPFYKGLGANVTAGIKVRM